MKRFFNTAGPCKADIHHVLPPLTRGQPWLVNALAYEACFRMAEGKERTRAVTAELLRQAAENLILRRDTHLDQLVDKLREPRVRRVLQPILAGEVLAQDVSDDDVQYVIDLGLLRREPGRAPSVANDIYKEVVPRALNPISGVNAQRKIGPCLDFIAQHAHFAH